MAAMRILALSCLLAAMGGGVAITPAAAETNSDAEKTFLILYRPGANWDASKRVWQQALGGHKDYLIDRYAAGALQFAGPFLDDWGGGVVVQAADADAAAEIAENDPAVQNKVFVYEVHPWFLVNWDEALAERGAAKLERKAESDVYKKGDRETVMRARLDAPPAQVFDAMTSPDQLRQWLSAGPLELVECEIDLRPGGAFRYVFRGTEGAAFVMYGNYQEVERPSRIVHLESYEGSDWTPLVVATDFTDDAGSTEITVTVKYPSMEIRDQDFPNLQHAVSTYERLAAFLSR